MVARVGLPTDTITTTTSTITPTYVRLTGNMSMLAGMELTDISMGGCKDVIVDLSHIPRTVTRLDLMFGQSRVTGDIGVVFQGMQLRELNLSTCHVSGDIAVFQGMPLKRLMFGHCDQITGDQLACLRPCHQP